MAGVHEAERSRERVEVHEHQGGHGASVHEEVVHRVRDGRKGLLPAPQGLDDGADLEGEQVRLDAVPGDIAHDDEQAAVGAIEEVRGVSGGMSGGGFAADGHLPASEEVVDV